MPNITSTMTNSVEYPLYKTTPGGESVAVKSVIIAGGANVASKHFQTFEGVVTEVTDEEVDMLLSNDTFKTHLENGFVKIHKTKKMQVKDLEPEDKAAPLTPKSYAKKGKKGIKAPKTTKE